MYASWVTNEWLPAVKRAIDRSRSPATRTATGNAGTETDIDIHRAQMIKYAREMFSWKMSANILIDSLNIK